MGQCHSQLLMAITVIPFFSPITPESVRNPILEKLRIEGIKVILPDEYVINAGPTSTNKERVYFFVGSGGTENLIESLIASKHYRDPILLLSYNGNNSLPAAMETRAVLEQKGMDARIIHAPLDELVIQLEKRTQFASILKRIGESKLGIVGEKSHWLIASGVNDEAVKARWGLVIEHYSLEPLLSRINDEMDDSTNEKLASFTKHASCIDISDEEIAKSAKVAHHLTDIVETEALDAITVECFDLLIQTNISGCYALSTLNERESFAAGCEGDIPSTFTMIIAKLLSGRPGFMANVIDVNESLNEATFAHCTVPISLTNSYRIMTHFETGMSLGLRGTFDPQRITVLKVSGDDLSKYWVSGGVITENLESESGCRTQIRVQLDEPVSYFLERSLANHHIIMLGDFAEDIKEFFSYAINGW